MMFLVFGCCMVFVGFGVGLFVVFLVSRYWVGLVG